jgi:hypothetical protein
MSLKEIQNNVLTQDNRCTDQPMFIVERLRKDYGYTKGYTDLYEWVDPRDCESGAVDDLKSKRLDILDKNYRDTEPYEKIYYKERWEFVQCFFYRKGCGRLYQSGWSQFR